MRLTLDLLGHHVEFTIDHPNDVTPGEFITASPGFDLDAAKAAMLADLRAALATGEGK